MNKIRRIIFFICFTALFGYCDITTATGDYKYTSDIEKYFKEYFSSYTNVFFTKVPRGLIMSFDSEIFFENSQDEIKEDSKVLLDKIAEAIKYIDKPCEIEGNTDKNIELSTEYFNNLELSIARAEKIANYFIQKGINPDRIRAIGYGEAKPIPHEVHIKNNPLNRIDFVLVNYDQIPTTNNITR